MNWLTFYYRIFRNLILICWLLMYWKYSSGFLRRLKIFSSIVYISWKCHKILRNKPIIFDASWQLKTKGRVISQNFCGLLTKPQLYGLCHFDVAFRFNLQQKSRKKISWNQSQIRVHQVIIVARFFVRFLEELKTPKKTFRN